MKIARASTRANSRSLWASLAVLLGACAQGSASLVQDTGVDTVDAANPPPDGLSDHATAQDVGTMDVRGTDATISDAASAEVGSDAPSDNVSSDGPVFTFDAGNYTCVSSDGGVCTATEAMIIQEKGEPCFNCLAANHCLDDDRSPIDVGKECDDFQNGVVDGGTMSGSAESQVCLATLMCLLSSDCSACTPLTCYCGTSDIATNCETNASTANGPCMALETAGLETNDPTMIGALWLNTTLPAGMANSIVNCARDVAEQDPCSACSSCFR